MRNLLKPATLVRTAFAFLKPRFISALGVLVLSLALPAVAFGATNATFFYNRGIEKQNKGDLAGAIADYGRAIKLDPKNAHAYYNRGNARRAKGDLDGAIEDYSRAIGVDQNYAYAYTNRGLAKKARGDLTGAMADYNRAIELDPKDAYAYYGRSEARGDTGDPNGAIDDYNRAIELDPQLEYASTMTQPAKTGVAGATPPAKGAGSISAQLKQLQAARKQVETRMRACQKEIEGMKHKLDQDNQAADAKQDAEDQIYVTSDWYRMGPHHWVQNTQKGTGDSGQADANELRVQAMLDNIELAKDNKEYASLQQQAAALDQQIQALQAQRRTPRH